MWGEEGRREEGMKEGRKKVVRREVEMRVRNKIERIEDSRG